MVVMIVMMILMMMRIGGIALVSRRAGRTRPHLVVRTIVVIRQRRRGSGHAHAHAHAHGSGCRCHAADANTTAVLEHSAAVVVAPPLRLRNDQKGGPLKEYHLVGVADPTKLVEVGLQQSNVGNQIGDNLRPRLVERLVPDGCPKALKVLHPARQTGFLDELLAVLQNGLPILLRHQIHLVDEQKDPGVRGVLLDGLQDTAKVVKVLLGRLALDVKDVDEELDAAKDGFPVTLEIRLVKGVLSAAVPQVEDQSAQKSDVVVFDVEGGGQAGGVACQVVGENNASHRGFAAVGFAHQQHFLLRHGRYQFVIPLDWIGLDWIQLDRVGLGWVGCRLFLEL
mmetsp:Transcript_15183/g.34981  ORF Transcript_15183/g.34981 Transcript_15183/m.34981 type:complete len:338 (-) Transcript_15183:133-1146(-)